MLVVSADSHFNEPIDFYQPLVKRYGKEVPYISSLDDGDYWVSGNFKRPLGVMNRPGQRGRGNTKNLKYEETMWFTDLASRKSFVQKDGVSGEVLFPSGAMLYTIENTETRTACMRHLNEFMQDLSGFYQGVVILPATPDQAYEMIKNFPDRGNAFLLPMYTGGSCIFERQWDAVLEYIQAIDGVLTFHAGTLDPNMRLLPSHTIAQSQVFKTSRLFFQAHHLILELVLGGVFDRFPNLIVVISELGASWVPYTIHRLKEGNSIYGEYDICEERITEIMRKNFKFTVQFDFPQIAGNEPNELHSGNIMLGTDFPHVESTFGFTKELSNTIIGQYGGSISKKILSSNTLSTFKKLDISA